MDSPELKLCPHCGETEIHIFDSDGGLIFFTVCSNCGMRGPEALKEDEAVSSWNSLPRRHEIMPKNVDCAGCPERRYRDKK